MAAQSQQSCYILWIIGRVSIWSSYYLFMESLNIFGWKGPSGSPRSNSPCRGQGNLSLDHISLLCFSWVGREEQYKGRVFNLPLLWKHRVFLRGFPSLLWAVMSRQEVVLWEVGWTREGDRWYLCSPPAHGCQISCTNSFISMEGQPGSTVYKLHCAAHPSQRAFGNLLKTAMFGVNVWVRLVSSEWWNQHFAGY